MGSHDMRGPVSIILIVYGRPTFTRMTLDTALADPLPHGSEVIVVSNHHSTEADAYILSERRRITHLVLSNENRGLAWAFNTGVGMARNHWVCVLENDVLCEPGWLDSAFGAHETFQKEVATGQIPRRHINKLLLGLTNHDLDRYERGKTPTYRVKPLGSSLVTPEIGVIAGSVFSNKYVFNMIGHRPGEGTQYTHSMPMYCRHAQELGVVVAYPSTPIAYHIQPQNKTWERAVSEFGLDIDDHASHVSHNRERLSVGR